MGTALWPVDFILSALSAELQLHLLLLKKVLAELKTI
jgi:hypothetical protein